MEPVTYRYPSYDKCHCSIDLLWFQVLSTTGQRAYFEIMKDCFRNTAVLIYKAEFELFI